MTYLTKTFLSGKSAYSIGNNVDQIKREIYTNGPVEGAFTVYEDFVSYKSGQYSLRFFFYLNVKNLQIT